eukprot:COSAG02_NODE_34817_length_478_cov_0.543536_1_plen_86_part_00
MTRAAHFLIRQSDFQPALLIRAAPLRASAQLPREDDSIDAPTPLPKSRVGVDLPPDSGFRALDADRRHAHVTHFFNDTATTEIYT